MAAALPLALLAVLGLALALRPGSQGGALANAPAGVYAVALRNDGAADTVVAVNAATGVTREIATLPHLQGYTSFAAVSPDGTRLAAVVADGGTPARPLASLRIVAIETGAVSTALSEIDQLQQPLWAPDGSRIFVTRTAQADGPAAEVTVLGVTPGGATSTVMVLPGVAGAYPVGFDSNGRLLVVAITSTGSVLYRDTGEPLPISEAMTRDWRVSPDGTALAFVEASLENGLEYRLRVVELVPGAARAQVAADPSGQQLGVAWHPSGSLAYGEEPGRGAARAQASGTPGFDVPLGFSPDGAFLAVETWSGTSFASPGTVALELIGPGGRLELDWATRFAGWTTR